RRSQALTLDRVRLAELLGSEELRELLDPAAIADLELELQGLKPERWPRDADEAHDLLARLGDLDRDELAGRGVAADWLEALVAERRARAVRVSGASRWIAAGEARRPRHALGGLPPPGPPQAFPEAGAGAHGRAPEALGEDTCAVPGRGRRGSLGPASERGRTGPAPSRCER